MAANSPQIEHVIAYHGSGTPPTGLFDREHRITGGPLTRMRRFRQLLRDIEPSIVHAHSSWAGGYARFGRRPGMPVIYQPHCYKFVDPTLSRLQVAGIRAVERRLLRNTTVTVVLSLAERQAALSLGSTATVEVPNVPTVPPGEVRTADRTRRRIVMVGRISPQKDPEFFSRVAQVLRRLTGTVEAVWVGDGDSDLKERLRQSGVKVTGWLDTVRLSELLSEGGVYVHTARYEGLPLSVLDAAQRGLPVVLRRVPSFTGVLEEFQVDTAEELAAEASRLVNDPDEYSAALARIQPWLEAHSNAAQAYALDSLYTQLIGPRSDP
ncbi:glycosyltransferase family 4 protein [Brevibacterium casei]|uniref:glycosyltransferase family 4 protein n=1 Tax=Brevibacterium casei TaxID=33889 RepID=UPI00223BC678|nr:glycosyltransferase family 4 protein [Brevibacterium casei]MCT1550183.1 glycosyltransferase family 4 protein [Brevibacterium casei]MCT1560109.1 glycosyltransferase family 4 protein [Brevibacterium casei]MCT2208263.1 glycosyltransferase family 4 protein [Brevibacterium casei]